MRKIPFGLSLLAIALLPVLGSAATKTVDAGGSGDFTTIAAAVAGTASGDTVIIKAGTYDEQVDISSRSNYVLKADTGAAVIINGPGGGVVMQVIGCTNVRIEGDASSRMTLNGNGGSFIVQVDGASNGTVIKNVNFGGPVAAGWFCSVNVLSSATFDNCVLAGTVGRVLSLQGGADVLATFNDCTLTVNTSGNFGVMHEGSGTVVFNRCAFNGAGQCALAFNNAGNPGTISAVDCNFSGTSLVYDDSQTGVNGSGGLNKVVELVKPTFAGNNGGIQVYNGGVKGIIRGKSATDKADLRTSNINLWFAAARTGGITLKDVITSPGAWTGLTVGMVDGAVAGTEIILDRCLVTADSQINFAGASNGALTMNAIDTIFEHKGVREFINSSSPAADSINLTHCTFYSSAPGASTTYITNNASDVITANYCIFDATGMTVTTSSGAIAGTLNIVNPAASVFGGSLPSGTIFGDPKLSATGHLTVNSDIADRKAVGSAETVDFDGQARPAMGTVADIGADEGFAVPVELSGFSAE